MLGHSLNCYISYCNFKRSMNLCSIWPAEAFCANVRPPGCIQFACTVNWNESHYVAYLLSHLLRLHKTGLENKTHMTVAPVFTVSRALWTERFLSERCYSTPASSDTSVATVSPFVR